MTPSATSCARSPRVTASTRAAPAASPRPAVARTAASPGCGARSAGPCRWGRPRRARRRAQARAAAIDAGQIVAGVQVRDVEGRGGALQVCAQANRREELQMIGEPVGHVWKRLARRCRARPAHRRARRERVAARRWCKPSHDVRAARAHASSSWPGAGCRRMPTPARSTEPRAGCEVQLMNGSMRAGGLVPYSIRVPAHGFSGDHTCPAGSRAICRACLDPDPHRFQDAVSRHDRRVRVGAAEAAHDVPRADGRVLVRVRERPAYKLDLIIGLFLCDFFQEGTKTGLLSIRAKGYLLTKARFPSWIVVVTSMSNAVITLALFSFVLIAFLLATGRPPSPRRDRTVPALSGRCSSPSSPASRSPPACSSCAIAISTRSGTS